MFKATLRSFYIGYQRLSFNGKVGLCAVFYNALFGGIFLVAYKYKTKKYDQAIERETGVSRSMTDDWLCYNTMRQYRQECSALDSYGNYQMDHCSPLEEVLTRCREKLADLILVDETPAMRPFGFVRNAPRWLRPDVK